MSCTQILFILILFLITLYYRPGDAGNLNITEMKDVSRERGTRGLFQLWALVHIPNFKCPENGENETPDGVCVHGSLCDKEGGTKIGECASNFGACCQFRFSASQQSPEVLVDKKVATLVNEFKVPSSKFIFHKSAEKTQNIMDNYSFARISRSNHMFSSFRKQEFCRIRLDFMFTMLEGPETTDATTRGDCTKDHIKVVGATNTGEETFTLCGNLDGQHVYLKFGASEKIEVTVTSSSRKAFEIRSTYVTCAEDYGECLQVYKETSGTIKSFNFVGSSGMASPQHLNNQKYDICVIPKDGAPSMIRWKECSNEEVPFFLSGSGYSPKEESSNCPQDFIAIDSIRHCGSSIGNNPKIYDFKAGNKLRVSFDNSEAGTPTMDLKNADCKDNDQLPEMATCQWIDNQCSCPLQNVFIYPTVTPGQCDEQLICHLAKLTDPPKEVCICPVNATRTSDKNNAGFCLQYDII